MYNSQLKILVTVADCGSFSRAAEKLFLSSTAVMKQINSLEEHLHLQLFERSRRGVFLTEAGQSIYEDALFLFRFSREAVERARKRADSGKNVLRIGSSLLQSCSSFMELWSDIRQYLPDVSLHIVPFEDDRNGILNEIGAIGEKFDLVVGVCGSAAMLDRANFFPLGEYHMCCALPPGHRLAAKALLEVADLSGECIVMGKRGDSTAVDAVRDLLEQEGSIRIEDTSYFYDIDVFNACERERKILLTLDCWSDIHPFLTTVPVNWSFTVPYGILYPLHPDQAILTMLSLLRTKCGLGKTAAARGAGRKGKAAGGKTRNRTAAPGN